MFTITKTQLKAIESASMSRFSERLAGLVASLRPDLQARVTPEVHDAFVRRLLETAKQFGMETEFECAVLAAAILMSGPEFLAQPESPLHQILARTEVEPFYRANQLLYELEQSHPRDNRADAGAAQGALDRAA